MMACGDCGHKASFHAQDEHGRSVCLANLGEYPGACDCSGWRPARAVMP